MPMALMALSEAVSVDYSQAILRGMGWLFGNNVLRVRMVDRERRIIFRSIWRRPPADRVALAANSAWALTFSRPALGDCRPLLGINSTCRPYHLGWLLYAWCGRENRFRPHDDRKCVSGKTAGFT